MAVDERLVSSRFPRASRYHPEWVLSAISGAANPLWLTEWLGEAMELRPGMRVLDLGCGRALSSVFLRREFGVRVWATDSGALLESAWASREPLIRRILRQMPSSLMASDVINGPFKEYADNVRVDTVRSEPLPGEISVPQEVLETFEGVCAGEGMELAVEVSNGRLSVCCILNRVDEFAPVSEGEFVMVDNPANTLVFRDVRNGAAQTLLGRPANSDEIQLFRVEDSQ